ncbi:hypothetical protein F3Y22_tig00111812pilonHSYRG00138 [Hibiscus syriacus]|uniref:Uncharacterized protein n=1 Tax=Hibiscus syriacus TaxID=106335 RepID=A0A6A2XZV2_HIBSY|nr:hypothetical protein F3Y22_tig00111812pilonHSYRG00138 [Hibiscus syriacus]
MMRAVQYNSYGGGAAALKNGLWPLLPRKFPNIPSTLLLLAVFFTLIPITGYTIFLEQYRCSRRSRRGWISCQELQSSHKVVAVLSNENGGALAEFAVAKENMTVSRPQEYSRTRCSFADCWPHSSRVPPPDCRVRGQRKRPASKHPDHRCFRWRSRRGYRLQDPEGEALKSPSGRKYDARPDRVDALRRVMLARRSSRIRQRARAIKSPYTPIVRRHRKKKPDSPVIPQESTPIVEEAPPIIPRESPPTVQEATVIIEEVPPPFKSPIHMATIPVSEEEREQLPDTILDNTLWAKTAVDFYLHERSQGCFTDICKLTDDIYLLLDRSWWGVLLGVEDNGYFDGGHIDAWVTRLLIIRKLKKNKNIRYTIMPTSFHAVHLKNARDESFDLGNGQAKLYPAWWEVDKVFILFWNVNIGFSSSFTPIP